MLILDKVICDFQLLTPKVEDIMLKIVKQLHSLSDPSVAFDESKYWTYFRKDYDTDITKSTKNFFSEISEDSPLAAIFKMFTLNIVAPAVLFLKNMISERYPYKDGRGCWTISVSFENDKIIVTHSKIEISQKEDDFQFSYENVFEYNQTFFLTFFFFIFEFKTVGISCSNMTEKLVP